MSKSKGNLVAPEEILDSEGADALRLAHLFVGPPEDDVDWEGVGHRGLLPGSCTGSGAWPTGDGRRRAGRPRADDADDEIDRGRAPAHRAGHRRLRALVLQHRGRRASWSSPTCSTSTQADDGPDVRRSTRCCCCWRRWRRTSPPSCGSAATPASTSTSSRGRWPTRELAQGRHRHDGRAGQRQGARPHRGRPPASTTAEAEAAGPGVARRSQAHLGGATPTKVIVRPPKLVNIVV